MIPLILALTFSTILTLVFAIPGIILCIRWFDTILSADSNIGVGDMKIPTFYAREPDTIEFWEGIARVICMFVVGGVFGGIHCVGWFFDFPSNAEAMLWRVSSAVITGVAFLFPIFLAFLGTFLGDSISHYDQSWYFITAIFVIILVVYVVSRLLLLVEAFISLRYLNPGMLALVKWTSFIPHI